MTELLEKLKTIFATTEPGLVIDKEFIQLRDDMKTRLNQGGRNDFKFTKDVDCLMLEEWLIKKNLVMATLDEHHESDGSCVYDCRIKLMNGVAFIDFKCVDEERNFNLGPEKFKNKPKFNNKSITLSLPFSEATISAVSPFLFLKSIFTPACSK